ncbi:RNA polymerase subunit sigma-70 [Viridibacillus sp. FSL H7-0596]|uniref:sigma factor-like helix-turn-helix DNA-binding protein n=1 Tax=Viridibacillus sp. FSL H7-0596 TaxID=1928923 RepID=UPI00096F9BBD|nr:sigma factor-like helix-turn-helix DNA-binding protein [Viridibacillus sp. FSL H7-0596]OMC86915.1 RNA polymerase subunit sigma-70 [Viridibacillus sp. FSL H7-0596]
MSNWADNLLTEYKEGRNALHQMKANLHEDNFEDETQINSMIESMTFAMDWMETGRQPDTYGGVDKKSIYQRQFFESIDVIPDITDELYDINSKQLYMTTDEKEVLAQIFASWSHRERVCYVKHVVEQKSFQKIADELNISRYTVRTHVDRAKKKIEVAIA